MTQVLVDQEAVIALHDAFEKISGATIALIESRDPEQRSAADRYVEKDALDGVEALAVAVRNLGGPRG
jgi:hypothetical protein